jgi:hypothetical protein
VAQKYSNALSQSNTISQDTIHLLFPGLNKLLNFQRKFLIRLEGTAEVAWKDQRWGLHFIENVSPLMLLFRLCIMLNADGSIVFLRHCFRFGPTNNRKKSLQSTNLTVPITPTLPS